jgi:hypothetical protein
MYISCMGEERVTVGQLNINMTEELEVALGRFMRLRGVRTKSEAIRLAVQEGVERSLQGGKRRSFRPWLGAATTAPLNTQPRFACDDDLWG